MRQSKTRWIFTLATITAVIATPRPIWAGDDHLSLINLRTLQNSFAPLADDLRPSVVAIHAYEGSAEDRPRIRLKPLSQGSGVIFKSNGYILTNYHVIENFSDIRITLLNGNRHQATIIQIDERADMAVLKIDADHLRAARFADADGVRVGHWTIAIGNPFGLANFTGRTAFTIGNISTLGRNLSDQLDRSDTRYYGQLIETSAAINPGNSGGPLFNIDGQIIGIVTAIETASGVNEGLGFAIPINDRTMKIIERLTRGEEVQYGYLGVNIERNRSRKTYDVRKRQVHGARINRIVPDSPAGNSVLQTGDVIVEFDGIPIEDIDQFVRVVGATPVGESVITKFVRHSSIQATTIRLGDRFEYHNATDKQLASEGLRSTNWRGAELFEINAALRQMIDLPDDARGLRVDEVRDGSDAHLKRLRPGQIITKVNGKPVNTIAKFRTALKANRLNMTRADGSTVTFNME